MSKLLLRSEPARHAARFLAAWSRRNYLPVIIGRFRPCSLAQSMAIW